MFFRGHIYSVSIYLNVHLLFYMMFIFFFFLIQNLTTNFFYSTALFLQKHFFQICFYKLIDTSW